MKLLSLLARAWFKLVVGPLRYGLRNYDAKRYWTDRYKKWRFALRGSGDESSSEEANSQTYREGFGIFTRLTHSVDFSAARTLDVWCGSGNYTGLVAVRGVTDYTGVDITDNCFAILAKFYPRYKFQVADCTQPMLAGESYDLILVIDVAEHITTDEGFAGLVENIKRLLAPGGTVVIGPVYDRNAKRLFYLRNWSVKDLEAEFGTWNAATLGYKGGVLVAYTKPGEKQS